MLRNIYIITILLSAMCLFRVTGKHQGNALQEIHLSLIAKQSHYAKCSDEYMQEIEWSVSLKDYYKIEIGSIIKYKLHGARDPKYGQM